MKRDITFAGDLDTSFFSFAKKIKPAFPQRNERYDNQLKVELACRPQTCIRMLQTHATLQLIKSIDGTRKGIKFQLKVVEVANSSHWYSKFKKKSKFQLKVVEDAHMHVPARRRRESWLSACFLLI